MARDWPDARGIFHNNDKNFLVWVNEEDHARVISMQKGGDMHTVFERFCEGLAKVEASIKKQGYDFMWNEHLGEPGFLRFESISNVAAKLWSVSSCSANSFKQFQWEFVFDETCSCSVAKN